MTNGGYITTDMIPQLEAYNEQIAQLNADLDANAAQTAAVNGAAAGAIAGAQNGRVAQSARTGNVAAPMNTPQGGQSFDNTGYATIGDAYADSLPALGQTFGDDVVNRAGANGGGYGLNDDDEHAHGSGGGYGGGMGGGSWGNDEEYDEKAGERIQENAQNIIDAAEYMVSIQKSSLVLFTLNNH